ncbi:MAG: cupin domain-containing protein [Xanthobacteraceae bacterium]|nr:cupin domain-containing protein [Xanthobacteraceae bacterium]MBV9626570.1 cupin domain-containing protein [Xanthobacteraceae bacterium]
MSEGKVRRVVTGHDASGKAIVSMDGLAPNVLRHPTRPGYFMTQIWRTASSPVPVDDGQDPTLETVPLAPPPNGTVIRIIEFPPEPLSLSKLDETSAKAAFAAIGGHDASTYRADARHPMMHRTESVDYGVILSGEIYLILDEQEVLVRAGDVVVQRGTNHAWSNRSSAPCRVAFILVDGEFTPELRDLFEKAAVVAQR